MVTDAVFEAHQKANAHLAGSAGSRVSSIEPGAGRSGADSMAASCPAVAAICSSLMTGCAFAGAAAGAATVAADRAACTAAAFCAAARGAVSEGMSSSLGAALPPPVSSVSALGLPRRSRWRFGLGAAAGIQSCSHQLWGSPSYLLAAVISEILP